MRRNRKFGTNRSGVRRGIVFNNRRSWLLMVTLVAVVGLLVVGVMGLMLWRWIFIMFFGLVLFRMLFGYGRRIW